MLLPGSQLPNGSAVRLNGEPYTLIGTRLEITEFGTNDQPELFAPGAVVEHSFEGLLALAGMTDEERREWFIKNDNFLVD